MKKRRLCWNCGHSNKHIKTEDRRNSGISIRCSRKGCDCKLGTGR